MCIVRSVLVLSLKREIPVLLWSQVVNRDFSQPIQDKKFMYRVIGPQVYIRVILPNSPLLWDIVLLKEKL